MPQLNGRELAQRVRALRPSTKVLFMSGYTDASVIHHELLDAATAFIQKPITPELLAQKVRQVLDSAAH